MLSELSCCVKASLVPLAPADCEKFILDHQWAYKYGAMLEFGWCDDHIDEEREIISRESIESCLDNPKCESCRIVLNGKNVGSAILKIDQIKHHYELEILFTHPDEHSKGIGYSAWQATEVLHPETLV